MVSWAKPQCTLLTTHADTQTQQPPEVSRQKKRYKIITCETVVWQATMINDREMGEENENSINAEFIGCVTLSLSLAQRPSIDTIIEKWNDSLNFSDNCVWCRIRRTITCETCDSQNMRTLPTRLDHKQLTDRSNRKSRLKVGANECSCSMTFVCVWHGSVPAIDGGNTNLHLLLWKSGRNNWHERKIVSRIIWGHCHASECMSCVERALSVCCWCCACELHAS